MEEIEKVSYYINPLNSLIGHAFIENLQSNCNIIGKVNHKDPANVPDNVNMVIDND